MCFVSGILLGQHPYKTTVEQTVRADTSAPRKWQPVGGIIAPHLPFTAWVDTFPSTRPPVADERHLWPAFRWAHTHNLLVSAIFDHTDDCEPV